MSKTAKRDRWKAQEAERRRVEKARAERPARIAAALAMEAELLAEIGPDGCVICEAARRYGAVEAMNLDILLAAAKKEAR